MKRTILAFLLTPIISSFLLSILSSIYGNMSISYLIGFTVNISIYAYIVTFVLGIPAYLLIYKANNLKKYWQFLLGGMAISIIPFLVLSILSVHNIQLLITCLLLGAITASVFWVIGEREIKPTSSVDI